MKRLPESKKIEMVLASFQEGVVITRHCKKYGVSRSTFYRCKSRVMEALTIIVHEKRPKKRKPLAKHTGKTRYRCRIK